MRLDLKLYNNYYWLVLTFRAFQYYQRFYAFLHKYERFQYSTFSFRQIVSKISPIEKWFDSAECDALLETNVVSAKFWSIVPTIPHTFDTLMDIDIMPTKVDAAESESESEAGEALDKHSSDMDLSDAEDLGFDAETFARGVKKAQMKGSAQIAKTMGNSKEYKKLKAHVAKNFPESPDVQSNSSGQKTPTK